MNLQRTIGYVLLLGGLLLGCQGTRSLPQSIAKGTVSKGSLKNGAKLPYAGENVRYFSPASYFLLNRAHVHDNVHRTLSATYTELNNILPGRRFRVMECSKKRGGKMQPHRTHQNGLSVDFMTPLLRKGKPWYLLDRISLFHYLLTFQSDGQWRMDRQVKIDFETMAVHILTLDKMARRHGLYIKKVIWQTRLKKPLFATPSGKQLKKKNIYFTRRLEKIIDNLHDDHYHIDFAFL